MSDSVWPHRQPTRLPHPWDSPGKNTGVGCHCLLRIERLSHYLLATRVFFFITSLFITPNHSSTEFLCPFFLSICKRLDLKALGLRQIPKCAVTFIFDKNSQWIAGEGNIRAVLLRKRQVKEREKWSIFTKVFRTWWTVSWCQISRECITVLGNPIWQLFFF